VIFHSDCNMSQGLYNVSKYTTIKGTGLYRIKAEVWAVVIWNRENEPA